MTAFLMVFGAFLMVFFDGSGRKWWYLCLVFLLFFEVYCFFF